MGSKNCAETPRQKMIGMMYLFLTAMLALNVSSEVLNGFTKVDQSLRESAGNLYDRNKATYQEFRAKRNQNEIKVKYWHETALKVGILSDTLYKQIQGYKFDIVRDADGPLGNPDSINAKDNLDSPTRVMLSKGKNSKGLKLKTDLNNYRNDLIDIMEEAVNVNGGKVNQAILNSINETLSTPESIGHDGAKVEWEHSFFAEMPISASIALLSKLQNDVRDAESQVIRFLLRQVDAKDFKVNKIDAYIIPKSTTIIKGSKFSAQILLAGRDTTKSPKYVLKENNTPINADDKGVYERICNNLGVFNINGMVMNMDDEGNEIPYKLNPISYEVIEPFATVSATKMNVLYGGVDNPVSVSVPGVGASDIEIKVSNGTFRPNPNGEGYLVVPTEVNTLTNITVLANLDGEMQEIKTYPFRVKQLPDPMAFIGYDDMDANGKIVTKTTNSPVTPYSLLSQFKNIVAILPNSDFEVEYTVLSFQIKMVKNNGDIRNFPSDENNFDAQTKSFLSGFTGDIIIRNIRATGPDRVERILPAIITEVK